MGYNLKKISLIKSLVTLKGKFTSAFYILDFFLIKTIAFTTIDFYGMELWYCGTP